MDNKTKEFLKPEKGKLVLFTLFALLFMLDMINFKRGIIGFPLSSILWVISIPLVLPYAFLTQQMFWTYSILPFVYILSLLVSVAYWWSLSCWIMKSLNPQKNKSASVIQSHKCRA